MIEARIARKQIERKAKHVRFPDFSVFFYFSFSIACICAATLLQSRLILVLLASRIWRALHEYVKFVHDPETQYKSLSVAHRPGGKPCFAVVCRCCRVLLMYRARAGGASQSAARCGDTWQVPVGAARGAGNHDTAPGVGCGQSGYGYRACGHLGIVVVRSRNRQQNVLWCISTIQIFNSTNAF
eukprot:COSAG05_NODE_1608_length_4413_cov_6.524108_1_plen_184_part_00